ncbi:hypothetical protein F4827_006392 [Paraburkholderia bannensis]|uniref:Uncharacterized protein n=1 Tax=Paraburkholderia bannensis TaxID=765414 RepID=A0A7W9U3S1_9BURK|nr:MULTISPECIES: hypothetical protein [Paraburkholderia]MBB3262258.1 hypothetical protein [Paraburkholderia sp. WP4_3_2]MBB6106517.1 hypothetical protein [Paraburkholderia bannensis]
MFSKQSSAVLSNTLSVRAATPRGGREHVYELNGSRLRDVYVDGQWVTVSVTDPAAPRVAA